MLDFRGGTQHETMKQPKQSHIQKESESCVFFQMHDRFSARFF